MSIVHAAAEPVLAVLPITALQVIKIADNDILLAGVGCHLKVINSRTRAPLRSQKVLECHAVHGVVQFAIAETKLDSGLYGSRIDVIVFGGRQLSWVVLDFIIRNEILVCSSLKVVDTFHAKDWILACKSSKHSQHRAAFVTSYNALYHLQASTSTNQLNCELLADSVGSFLYSADLTQTNESAYLVASGTVFGQVLVWRCVYEETEQNWIVIRWIQFDGHRGSIFGVNISRPRILEGKEFRTILSCSDDRMICAWKLPGLDVNFFSSGMTTTKEFQQCDQTPLQTYGHLSRIWDVSFSYFEEADYTNPLIISAGEDSQVQSWSFQDREIVKTPTPNLRKEYVDRHHAGKNIWAQCHTSRRNKLMYFSGGADGQIVVRYYDRTGQAGTSPRALSNLYTTIPKKMTAQVVPKNTTFALKTYIATSSLDLLATSNAGHILRCTTATGNQVWEAITQDPRCIPLVPSLTVIAKHVFFVRESDQQLCAVQYHNARLVEVCPVRQARIANIWTTSCSTLSAVQNFCVCAAITYHDGNDVELYWIEMIPGEARLLGKSAVLLPVAFEVTSLLYDNHRQILLCGSRAGGLAISTNVSSTTIRTDFHICRRRVHGQDSVTSICKLESEPSQLQSFYLTTGRDGTYCVHKLVLHEARSPCVTTVHQITPPVGPDIEGATVIHRPDGTQGLLLFGFHSKNFMVWDETSQTQIMNVDCGGAHRSWMFSPYYLTGHGGTFAWRKASTFMFYQQTKPDHEIVQTGGHGREIKALATHKRGQHQWLLATGSEDTDIRLFEYSGNPSKRSERRTLTVLRRHTTGLQDLHFSPDGTILLSAAGMEELYAWCLSPVPIIGQGVVFACAPFNSDHHSEARIMSIDMKPIDNHLGNHNPSYLVTAASSNGKLKVLQLNSAPDPAEMQFIHLHVLDFGTICLTQAHICLEPFAPKQSSTKLLIGATNGSIACSEILTHDTSSTPVTAGSSPKSSNSITLFDHKLHQNAITALGSLSLNSKHDILVTGGDDNALVITLVTKPSNPTHTTPYTSLIHTLPEPQIQVSKYTYKSLVIPTAHAAALTALHLSSVTPTIPTSSIDKDMQHFRVITAGNDQRVQAWSITVDMSVLEEVREREGPGDGRLMDEVQVDWLGEWYTNVADISAMDVLSDAEGEGIADFVDVLVVGVGMEVLRLDMGGVGT